MPDEGLRVEGVRELISTFRKIDRGIASGISRELRSIAKDVAQEARTIAVQKGLAPPGRSGRGRGDLLKHVKVSVRGGNAAIVEDVTRDGYPYARIYEYGHGGVRAFMRPAADNKKREVVAAVEHLLDEILSGSALTSD